MSTQFVVEATARAELGKGASRRLRRANIVPAVIYGGEAAPVSISLVFKDFIKFLEKDEFYSAELTVTVDGNEETVILKDLQRHPSKGYPMHADFLRVAK